MASFNCVVYFHFIFQLFKVHWGPPVLHGLDISFANRIGGMMIFTIITLIHLNLRLKLFANLPIIRPTQFAMNQRCRFGLLTVNKKIPLYNMPIMPENQAIQAVINVSKYRHLFPELSYFKPGHQPHRGLFSSITGLSEAQS